MSEASPTRGQCQLQMKKRSAETVRLMARARRKRRAVRVYARARLAGWMDGMRGFFAALRMTT